VRRTLVVVVVGMVLGSVVLAGFGTFLLAQSGAATDDARILAQQVRRVADEAPVVLAVRSPTLRRRLVRVVRVAAGVDIAAVVPSSGSATPAGGAGAGGAAGGGTGASGAAGGGTGTSGAAGGGTGTSGAATGAARIVAGSLPAPLTAARLPLGRMLHGSVVSGTVDGHVYAAAVLAGVDPADLAGTGSPRFARAAADAVVVVAAVRTIRGAALGGGYLLLVSAGVVLVAAGIAVVLSRRMVRPLAQAVAATHRVAAGDLSVRLPADDAPYPELRSLGVSINAMTAALAEARDRERQFLLSVSHDLRTPLTAIQGYAEAITDGIADDPVAAAEVIGGEARRLGRLVGDLLDLARLDTHRFSLHPAPTSMVGVVRAAVNAAQPTVIGAGVTATVAVPDGDPLDAVVDPDRAAQVLANLVDNAASFATATLCVRAWRPEPGTVAVAVLDDGPGIPADELPHVFEPLFRGRHGSGRRLGSGLGLAIVAELVAAMGGDVHAWSPVPAEVVPPGVAATWRTAVAIRLPAARPG
jgi:signal transduction histidine kinase